MVGNVLAFGHLNEDRRPHVVGRQRVLRCYDGRGCSSAGTLRAELGRRRNPTPAAVAAVFARTLAARGAFCDLLAQAPLNLERNVSVEAVRAFKLVTHTEVDAIALVVRSLLPTLSGLDAVDLIAAATSLSGAFWQMATPGPGVRGPLSHRSSPLPRGVRCRTAGPAAAQHSHPRLPRPTWGEADH